MTTRTELGVGTVSQFVFGPSPAMHALRQAIGDLGATNTPILLEGESGVGKEVFALEVHQRSGASSKSFIKLSCTRLRQPFQAGLNLWKTGPSTNANTVFLDEVSQLDLASQDLLLEALRQEGEQTEESQVRIIAATTKNLRDGLGNGRFHHDLYYRISGIHLYLPPLRHRKEDIPCLLEFFLKRYCSLFNRPIPEVTARDMETIQEYSWPGNVRELENFVRTLLLSGDIQLALADLSCRGATAEQPRANRAVSNPTQVTSLKQAAREASRKAERELILRALERTHWNRKRTAVELQISYKALLYKLKQMNQEQSDDDEVCAESKL